jgi:hypothetical protein
MSGRSRKLRVDARWRQFTESEQDHIREIFQRDGLEEAVAYCQKIGKTWSGPAMSRFFHREHAGGSSQILTRNAKLRSTSHWWQLTELERGKIQEIFDNHGQMAAAQYCRQIGKPWSHTAISRFFANERAARRAEDIEIRKGLARLKELIAIHTRAGMGIAEATAVVLADKLGDAIRLSEVDPKTTAGLAIITKAAPHLIALRALELRCQEVELLARRVAVLEKKLAQTLPKNEEGTDLPDKPESWYDARTEMLGRAIFGDNWDYQPKKTIDPAQSDPIQPNQSASQETEATPQTEATPKQA